jgi:hypothetical protein
MRVAGENGMSRWVRDGLSLAATGGFVWMAWQAALMLPAA